jgi:hypothetical protein
MEGSFLYVSITGTAETSDFPLAFLCALPSFFDVVVVSELRRV